MNRAKKLVSNSIIFTIGNIGTKLIAFLMVPLYTYTLSRADYGQIDILMTTVSLFLPITTLSIFDAVFRFSMDSSVNVKEILTSGIIVTALIALVELALYPFLFFFHFKYALAFLLILISTALFTLIQNFARAIGKSKIFALAGIINGFCFAILNVVFLVVWDFGIKGYLYSYLISIIMGIVYLVISLKSWQYIDVSLFSLKTTKKMLHYSIPLIPNSLAWWLTSDANRFIILTFIGVSANGLFAVANKIPSLLNMMFNIFTQAWQISAVEEYDSEDVDVFYSNTFDVLQSFLFLIVASILIIIRPLLNIIISPEFSSVWQYVPILLISSLFSNLSAFLGTVFLAVKKTSGLFSTTVVGIVVNLVISFIFTPIFGINGTALGGSVGFFTVMLIRFVYIQKYVNVRLNWIKFLSSFIGIIIISVGLYITNILQVYILVLGFIIIFIANISLFGKCTLFIKSYF